MCVSVRERERKERERENERERVRERKERCGRSMSVDLHEDYGESLLHVAFP